MTIVAKSIIYQKRNNGINHYEEVYPFYNDRNKLSIIVNLNEHKGSFTYIQILDFKECCLTYNQLNKRMNNLINKVGSFFTLNDVIITLGKGKNDNVAIDKKDKLKRQEKEDKLVKENQDFNYFMTKIMKVGSLHKKALIIQGKKLVA